MKLLITGGSGFTARNLTEHLKDKHTILSPNSKELDLLNVNVVHDYLEKHFPDHIIHTATYDAAPKHSTKDPTKTLEYNLRMFYNLEKCKPWYTDLITLGSGAEYGRENWKPKMKESYFGEFIPTDQYGFSKYIINKHVHNHNHIVNLRLFAVFGKYEDYRVRFISNACCRAIMDLPIIINQNAYYDFMDISDLAKIVEWFIDNYSEEKSINVCTGISHDLHTIAKKVVEISGKNVDIIIRKEGMGNEYSGDNTLLCNKIRGLTFKNIDTSIKDLYDWYVVNKHTIDKESLWNPIKA